MFNSDDRAKTIHAVLKELKQAVKNGDLSSNVKFDKKSIELGMSLIEKRYSKILPNFSSYFNTGMGTQLQFYDSCIAEAVLLHFSSLSKPCYSVHDSFIVLRDDKALLEQVMLEKYQSIIWNHISNTSKSKLKNKSNINIFLLSNSQHSSDHIVVPPITIIYRDHLGVVLRLAFNTAYKFEYRVIKCRKKPSTKEQ